jgi:malonyl-ACP O-methyltransferase BioC
MKENKEIIRKRFARSFKTYDEQAHAQEQIAASLTRLIEAKCSQPETAMEIGCGTGLLTKKLFRWTPDAHWYLNDIVEELKPLLEDSWKAWGAKKVDFRAGDAEQLDIPQNLDLVVSASTIQWFGQLDTFFNTCHKALNENGQLVFSTFGPNNLKEVKKLTGNGLEYPSQEELEQLLKANFKIEFIQQENIKLVFKSPTDVLRHLSKTGVNGSGCNHWNKAMLNDFCKKYIDQFSSENGVKLTYQPIYVVASKK